MRILVIGKLKELMRAYVFEALGTAEFSTRYISESKAVACSEQFSGETDQVKRGVDLIFTAIDSLDSDIAEQAAEDRVREILLAEVRAVYGVLWGDDVPRRLGDL